MKNTLNYGILKVNLSTNSTYVDGKEVELLGKEFDLLVYFLQNQNVILQRPRFSIVSGALIVTQPSQWLKSMFKNRKKLKVLISLRTCKHCAVWGIS